MKIEKEEKHAKINARIERWKKTLKPGERESKLEVETNIGCVEKCKLCKMYKCDFGKEKVFDKAVLVL